MADLGATIAAWLAPVANRVKALLARGTVDGVQDGTMAQELRLRCLRTEVLGRVENLAGLPGLTSYPPLGSEVVVGCIGGMRDHPIVLAVNHRPGRPTGAMAEGDVILYHPLAGTRIHLHADGSVDVSTSAGVRIAGDLTVTGSISATGDVADGTRSMAADRAIFNQHVHKENGEGGGVTDPPAVQQ